MAIWLHFQNSVQKYYCIISSSSWARKWIRIVRNRVTKWRSRCYFSYGFIYGRITPSVTMSPHNDLWWSLEIGNKIRICLTLSRVLTRRRGRHMQRGCWHSSLAQVNWSAQQATAQSIGLYRTGARAARRGGVHSYAEAYVQFCAAMLAVQVLVACRYTSLTKSWTLATLVLRTQTATTVYSGRIRPHCRLVTGIWC